MQQNSPWFQKDSKKWSPLENDKVCDVAIVGGGISGVATLYFLLTQTNQNVLLVEKDHIASGATGHNAGLAVAHIEKPLTELVKEFGVREAKNAFEEVFHGWRLLLDIIQKIGIHDDFMLITQTARGFTSIHLLIQALHQEKISQGMDYAKSRYFVVESFKEQIPEEFHVDLQFVSKEAILETLKCFDQSYIGVSVPADFLPLARINSALLCYRILSHLEEQFSDRVSVCENTEITHIHIYSSHVELETKRAKLTAKDIVLCTNGYKNFIIVDQERKLKLEKIHNSIETREGYLVGFTDSNVEIYGTAFFDDREEFQDVPYFYLSHAPIVRNAKTSLVVLGGPEFTVLNEGLIEETMQKNAKNCMEIYKKFLKDTYHITKEDFEYFWGGVMGYTKTGLRWVGKDPHYSNLWYNLGCNGIGIVPAIAGAEKIAQLMNGKELPPSIFDPPK